MKAAGIAGLLAALLSGCSTSVQVSPLVAAKLGDRVDGVPFRVPKRFDAVIYEKRAEGYVEVHRMPVTVADPERLYLLQMTGQPLSNATVEVVANADNTLQQVSVKSASTFAAALTATGTQLNAIATAQQTKDKAEAATATATSSASIAADKAFQAANEAQLDYDLLLQKTDATPAALLAAKNKARSKKLDANEAARLANKPSYFSDVIP